MINLYSKLEFLTTFSNAPKIQKSFKVEPEKPPEIAIECIDQKSENKSQILQIAKYDAGNKTWQLDIPEICKGEETSFT